MCVSVGVGVCACPILISSLIVLHHIAGVGGGVLVRSHVTRDLYV